jgi:RNA polymerase sigma factor (sigma-70 family)
MVNAALPGVLHHLRSLRDGQALAEVSDGQLLEWFARGGEEAAFASLVRRHGPMVWGVARRVLPQAHDAEDVFQATFLLLARKAPTIRKADSVGSWLHGVAHRLALKARLQQARRQSREKRAADMRQTRPGGETSLSEVQSALDTALGELPEKYRAALVSCYLEGQTQEEAARRLGCPLATVRTRVARGRKLLRDRLAKHGLALSTAGLATLLIASAAPAAAPAARVKAAVEAALPFAAGQPAAALRSRQAAGLVEEGLKTMFPTKVKTVTALLLAAGLVAGAAALAQRVTAANQAAKPPAVVAAKPAAATKPATDEKGDSIEVSGRVVDPSGKPVAGAKVFFKRYILDLGEQPPGAVTSDAEGRFRLRVARTGYRTGYDHEKTHWLRGAVVAVARGFAPGWVGADNVEKLANVTVQLVRDVPIEGRVVDLEGKPIAAVSVRVRSVGFRLEGEDLKAFVAALQARQWPFGPHWPGMRLHPNLLGLTRPAVTGADGKFRLAGIPGECLVALRFAGPTIETAEVFAMTRPGPTILVPRTRYVFHGARFEHAAAPTRPITGVVRDRDTGKPLAGVTIQARLPDGLGPVSQDPYLRATTDAKGRYRLVGLSRQGGHRLQVLPGPRQPYLPAARTSGTAAGLDPVTVDFRLKRGVWIRGRVTSKETGRPVPALVQYGAFVDNPLLKEAAGLRDSDRIEVRTAEDGTFTLVGLPGRGLLAVKAADRQAGRYVMAAGADEIKGPRFGRHHFNTEPSPLGTTEFNTLAEVNPARDAESIVRDLVLDPGKTMTGTIVGPDGKPVKGGRIDGAVRDWFHGRDLPTAQFRIMGIDPKHPRWFIFRHPGKNLGAIVLVKGNEQLPWTVRLQKCATITGRLVDEDDLPRSAWLMGGYHKGQLFRNGIGINFSMRHIGKDGRFRIEGVIPGLKIGLFVGKNTTYFDPLVEALTLQAGEVKDLGEVKAKPAQ